jgi:hypothetical protein
MLHKTTQNTSPKRRSAWIASAMMLSVIASRSALACGPDFPIQLQQVRTEVLQGLPEPSFIASLNTLSSTAPSRPIPVFSYGAAPTFQSDYLASVGDYVSAAVMAEQRGLSVVDAAITAKMRATSDHTEAFAIGESLEPEIQLYTAGAVAFANEDYEAAIDYWQQLLALPSAEQQQRRAMALYSLSRAHAVLQQPTQQLQRLEQLQAEVAAGLADPLWLAATSLGDTAALALAKGDWPQAIREYSAQANYDTAGDSSGRDSLLMLARQLASMSASERAPMLQSVEVSSLLARFLATRFYTEFYGDSAALKVLLKELVDAGTLSSGDATYLAALSYRQGWYTEVSQFIPTLDQSALAWWLRAKLALQQGDIKAATAAFAHATQAMAQDQQQGQTQELVAWQDAQRCRLKAEQGILALTQADYRQALDFLWQSGAEYWQDTAYLAERVLSTAELRAFVDSKVAPLSRDAAHDEAEQASDYHDWELPVDQRLRQLLARRLMREGEGAAAVHYFSQPALKALAEQYHQLRLSARSQWRDVHQAEALFVLARMTREHGMALLGFELAPDFAIFQGSYSWDEGMSAAAGVDEQHRVESSMNIYRQQLAQWSGQQAVAQLWQNSPYAVISVAALPDATQPLDVTAQETDAPQSAAPSAKQHATLSGQLPPGQILSMSQGIPRFHYRYLASALAAQAADKVPASSQAFAALLCHSSLWLLARDPAAAAPYYRRYLAQGPYVAWGAQFGQQCPEPNFDAAHERQWQLWQAQLWAWRYPLAALGFLAMLSAGLYALIRRRRRS